MTHDKPSEGAEPRECSCYYYMCANEGDESIYIEKRAYDQLRAQVAEYEKALESAHEKACHCCDSSSNVEEHCKKALEKWRKGGGK